MHTAFFVPQQWLNDTTGTEWILTFLLKLCLLKALVYRKKILEFKSESNVSGANVEIQILSSISWYILFT